MSFFRAVPPFLLASVIEICSALHPRYPADDGGAAVLRSMPANSRRVRYPSVSSNQ